MSAPVEPQLRAAIALNEAHRARLKRRLRLSWAARLVWWAPLTLGALFFPADDRVYVFALIPLVLSPTLRPNDAQRGLARSIALLTELTADLHQTLTEDDETQWALWAERSARMAAIHSPAFVAPPLTDAQRQLGAWLAATQRLKRALEQAPAPRPRVWEAWVRPAVAALASSVGCVAVVVERTSGGVLLPTLMTVTLVICMGLVIGALFYDPPWSYSRRRQRAEAFQWMAEEIREFLEDDDELCLDDWLRLRAEHDERWGVMAPGADSSR